MIFQSVTFSTYKVSDMLTLSQQSSSVTRQLVAALTGGGLNPQCPGTSPTNISLHGVTIDIPSMLHTALDTVINTVGRADLVCVVSIDILSKFSPR